MESHEAKQPDAMDATSKNRTDCKRSIGTPHAEVGYCREKVPWNTARNVPGTASRKSRSADHNVLMN